MPQDKWTPDLLLKMKQQGDVAADHVLEQLIEEEGDDAVDKFFEALISNIELPVRDLPPFMLPFTNALSSLPSWADKSRLDRSEKFFIDHGPKWLVILYFKSLPTLYSCADGAQVLVQTGRLAHKPDSADQTLEVFARRIGETGQYLLDVMCHEAFDNTVDTGRGFVAIQKVRLIHASVRQFVQRGRWDAEKLGIPINQLHLAMTLMTFSVSLLDGLVQLGLVATNEDEEAFIHRWNVIGHLMGVDKQLLPENAEDARNLLAAIISLETRPSEAGEQLTQALIKYGQQIIPGEKFDFAPGVFMNYLNSAEILEAVGIQALPAGCAGAFMPDIFGKALGWTDRFQSKNKKIETLTTMASKLATTHLVDSFRAKKPDGFSIPESIANAWK